MMSQLHGHRKSLRIYRRITGHDSKGKSISESFLLNVTGGVLGKCRLKVEHPQKHPVNPEDLFLIVYMFILFDEIYVKNSAIFFGHDTDLALFFE